MRLFLKIFRVLALEAFTGAGAAAFFIILKNECTNVHDLVVNQHQSKL